MSSLHRSFQSSSAYNQYTSTNMIPHHPWKSTSSSSSGNNNNNNGGGRKIDRFLRSKRRKKPSWDGSSIVTESTGNTSSQSSVLSGRSSSSSPVQILRKMEEPKAQQPPPEQPLPLPQERNRDPRGTISSAAALPRLPQQQQQPRKTQQPPQLYIPIDVDSLQEYKPSPPPLPRAERGVFRREHHDDLKQPLPPRSPAHKHTSNSSRVSSSYFVAARTSSVAPLPPPPPPRPSHHHHRKAHSEPLRPSTVERAAHAAIGPIDVDSMEAYYEDESVDSLAMMNIEDPDGCNSSVGHKSAGPGADQSDELSISRPDTASRQRTSSSCTDSIAFSSGTSMQDEMSIPSAFGDDEDGEYDADDDYDDDLDPLGAFSRLQCMEDLLAESDGEEDEHEARRYWRRHPVFDEREHERGLCGYIQGFEPPTERVHRRAASTPVVTTQDAFEI